MVKRVLCLVSIMNTGGAETFLMKIYRKLDRTKYQMDFGVYSDQEGFYDEEIRSMGGKVHHLIPKTKNFSLYKKSLYDLVSKEKYEYVLRITSNAAGFYDLKIAKEAGARVCIARSSNSSDGGSWRAKVVNFLSRVLYQKYVDVKIAPSDLAAEYTFGKKAVAKGEVHFLNNGLDLDVYRFSQTGRDRVRKEFNIEGKFVVGHIGRFSHQKNHNFLIDIFAEIRKKNSDAVLLLVGDGELKGQIQNKVNQLGLDDSVIFAGIRKDIPALLSAMDVFVFPSFYEGMPNTVIEAQATGLPCVISNNITKVVNMGAFVCFLNLNKRVSYWVDNILVISAKHDRTESYKYLIKLGYNIDDVIKNFLKLIFQYPKSKDLR